MIARRAAQLEVSGRRTDPGCGQERITAIGPGRCTRYIYIYRVQLSLRMQPTSSKARVNDESNLFVLSRRNLCLWLETEVSD